MIRFFKRGAMVQCERNTKPRSIQQEDVAVAVSHNEQKRLLRVALDDEEFFGVEVNTANKL